MVLLAHTHHGSFLLGDTVGRAGKALLLPGRHLIRARGARWKREQHKYKYIQLRKSVSVLHKQDEKRLELVLITLKITSWHFQQEKQEMSVLISLMI